MVKQYIRFWIRSLNGVTGHLDVEVPSRDVESVVWPDDAYAFQFFTRVEGVVRGEVVVGEPTDVSMRYYHPDSRIMSRHDLMLRGSASDMELVASMTGNGIGSESVIFTRWGDWPQPYVRGQIEVLPTPKKP